MRTGRELLAALGRQLPMWVALVVIWILLWGSVSVMTIVTGVVLAVALTTVLYLPPMTISDRIQPFASAWFLIVLVASIVWASLRVAGQALALWWQPVNSMVRIDLHSRSDFILTLTAEALSLVPGTVVVEVDRVHYRLYVHSLSTGDARAVERTRREVLAMERRLVNAIGSRLDVQRLKVEAIRARREAEGGPA